MKDDDSAKDTVITHGGFHTNYREEMAYFAGNRVYSFQIESNLSCPQGCLYCYASDENSILKEMPEEDIRSLLRAAVKMEVRAIDWLGGDPLLRDDWYALMKYARELGLINNIWTSGLPLANKAIAEQAVAVTGDGFIAVHLDTLNERIYQQLHSGDPYRKIQSILKGVENVQSLGKNPENMINCITFTRLVAKDVEKTIRYFYEEKRMRTCLTQMCRTGLARNHPEWIPDLKEIKAAGEIRDQLNYPGSTVSFCAMDVNKYYCGGTVCITVDGDVTPCSVIRKSAGNIHDCPIERIIDEHRDELLMTRLRNPENLSGDCAVCESNGICWGCRATAYYETGDLFGPDPKCYKKS